MTQITKDWRQEVGFSAKLLLKKLTPDSAATHYGGALVIPADVRSIRRQVSIFVLMKNKRIRPKDFFVLGGDWDINTGLFAEDETCIDVIDILVNGKDYTETTLYRRYLSRMACHEPEIHHGELLDSIDKLRDYFLGVHDLYESIKSKGYKSRQELGQADLDTEIGVAIGRRGELLHFRTGHHRLAIVKILDIKQVPVVVHFVHSLWIRSCVKKHKTIPSLAILKELEEMRLKFSG